MNQTITTEAHCKRLAFKPFFGNILFVFPGSSPPAGGGRAVAMFFVYAIYNKKVNKFYICQTYDLVKRINEHNQKTFKGYTSRFDGVWEIIYKEEIVSREEALKREKQLKSYQGRQFIKSYIPW